MSIARRVGDFGGPLSSEEVTVPTSGVSSALTIPAKATAGLASARGIKVRWRSDGSNPTVTVGHPIEIDGYAEFGRADLEILLFASSDGATVGYVLITYYGE